MEFAGEHQEGLAVDDELGGGAALFEVRGGGVQRRILGRTLGKALGGEEGGKEQQSWQRAEWVLHDARKSTIGSIAGWAGRRRAVPFRRGVSIPTKGALLQLSLWLPGGRGRRSVGA